MKKHVGARIGEVEPGSAAASAGLKAGDVLVSLNGHVIRDSLDYQFYSEGDELELVAQTGGERCTYRLRADGSLGLSFNEPVFDGVRVCRNRCRFCFIDQLPKGMRATLRVKDDDYRYSFLYGNFVTLTQLTEDDWARLAEQRISPLRVSVHATETELRRYLLGKPDAPDIIPQLQRLNECGIQVHCQVVLCPGLNDGEHLERTVRDLAALYPGAQSIAVVPVGLTKYRDIAVADIVPVTEAKAREVVGQVKGWQREFRRNLGVGLVYLGDEFYFLAGHPFPSGRSYDGYPQYENGVGLVRTLLDEAARLRRKWGTSAPAGGRTMVACGTRIAPLLREVLDELGPAMGWEIAVVPVENRFFGPSVNVSGLLTGEDVIEALRGKGIGDVLVLPRAMLDDGCERFLDNMTPFDMQRELGVPVVAAGSLCQLAQVLANRGWLCAA